MQQRGARIELPPLPVGADVYLSEFLALGIFHYTGFGPVPLPFTEIAAAMPWANARERHLIRSMSVAYLKGREIGDDDFGIPPWVG